MSSPDRERHRADQPAPGIHTLDLDEAAGVWLATTSSGATYGLDTDAHAVVSVPPGAYEAAAWDGVWVRWESIWAFSARAYDIVLIGDDLAFSYWMDGRPRVRRSTPVVSLRRASEEEFAALPARLGTDLQAEGAMSDDSLLDALERLRRETGGVDLPIPPRDDRDAMERVEGLFSGDGDENNDEHQETAE